MILWPVSFLFYDMMIVLAANVKGSDIVLEAILEAEVAHNAKEFFSQPQNQNQPWQVCYYYMMPYFLRYLCWDCCVCKYIIIPIQCAIFNEAIGSLLVYMWLVVFFCSGWSLSRSLSVKNCWLVPLMENVGLVFLVTSWQLTK